MSEEKRLNKISDEVNFMITNASKKELFDYIVGLEIQRKKYKEVIDKAINDIDLVIELIKQQPTEDDSWILGRLNAFKIILKEVE